MFQVFSTRPSPGARADLCVDHDGMNDAFRATRKDSSSSSRVTMFASSSIVHSLANDVSSR